MSIMTTNNPAQYNVAYEDAKGASHLYLGCNVYGFSTAQRYADRLADRHGKPYPNGEGTYHHANVRVIVAVPSARSLRLV